MSFSSNVFCEVLLFYVVFYIKINCVVFIIKVEEEKNLFLCGIRGFVDFLSNLQSGKSSDERVSLLFFVFMFVIGDFV